MPAACAGPADTTAASTATVITGTNSRKQAWPWTRNQPDSANTQASWPRPATTDAAASRKTTYVGTYM